MCILDGLEPVREMFARGLVLVRRLGCVDVAPQPPAANGGVSRREGARESEEEEEEEEVARIQHRSPLHSPEPLLWQQVAHASRDTHLSSPHLPSNVPNVLIPIRENSGNLRAQLSLFYPLEECCSFIWV